jgi:hypothetical protein
LRNRFKVDVRWQSAGGAGTGAPKALTGDTGYFWFFDDKNIELLIKILDGTSLNQHFWVFYGALSDVRYTITIEDTVTKAKKVYTNPQGNLASVADTKALRED